MRVARASHTPRSRVCVAASDGSVEGHDGGDDAVNFLGGLLLVGLDIPSWVGAHVNVIGYPGENGTTVKPASSRFWLMWTAP